jgi:hypothetical protein
MERAMQNLVCFPLAYSNTLPAERIRLLWSGFFPPFPFGKWGKVVLGGKTRRFGRISGEEDVRIPPVGAHFPRAAS